MVDGTRANTMRPPMTTSVIFPQFLQLPDDILLEILAQLPAFLVVLCFRPVCRKIDQLSRERHLWIGFFFRTRHMLRRPIDLEQVGTSEFEIGICRAEMLEGKWSQEEALWIVPRFWRGSPREEEHARRVVAIMGDYLVIEQGYLHNWVPISDLNGPPLCSFAYPSGEGWGRSYMELRTSTFYMVSQAEYSLNVIGIRASSHGPSVAVEYSLPLRDRHVSWAMNNGFIVVRYFPSAASCRVDIIDLEKRALSMLSLPSYPLILQQTGPYPIRRTFATGAHIIEIYAEQKYAIFERPTSSQGLQWPGVNADTPGEDATHLEPIVKGSFPWSITSGPYIIPRTATSFAMIIVPRSAPKIHVFFFTSSETKSSFEDIYSVDIPNGFYDFVLPIPPPTAQYALGVLSVQRFPPDVKRVQGERGYFAVRIDLPDPEQELASKKRGNLTLQRMHLTPAVNDLEEQAILSCFDCFSGKISFVVLSNAGEYDLVLDYLSVY